MTMQNNCTDDDGTDITITLIITVYIVYHNKTNKCIYQFQINVYHVKGF